MMLPVTCEDFERAGSWDTGRCCPSCHADAHGIDQLEPYDAMCNARGVDPVHAVAELCCKHREAAPTRGAVAAACRSNRHFWRQEVDFDALDRGELPA